MRSWIVSIALLLTMYAVQPTSAHAQTSDNTFCYVWNVTSNCFDTREAAEAAMRSALPASYQNVIKPKTPVPNGYQPNAQGLEQWRVDYFIPDQAPETMYPPTHTVSGWNAASNGICAASNDPLDPNGCLDGDAAAQAMYQYFVSAYPSCTFVKTGYTGAYASPFASVKEYAFRSRYGVISYVPNPFSNTRKLNYTIWCPGWVEGSPPDPRDFQIYKMQTFLCPDRFTPLNGFSSLS